MRIAVHGANGYQGRLVLTELARRGVDTVLTGRDAARLREAAVASGRPDAERRLADSSDHASLVRAFDGCAAVVNCAGPFVPAGIAVVRAAIAAGCHYTDTAGEQAHVTAVFDTLADDARRAGVTVVPAANDGCVPADLLAHLLAERLGGDELEEIVTTHVIVGGGGMSRGSLRSLAATIDVVRGGGLVYEDGAWRAGTPVRHVAVTLPGDAAPTPVTRFPMAEVVTVPRHVRVRRVEGLAEAALRARLDAVPGPEVIARLPDGPPDDARREQRFTYVVDAVAADRRRARGVVRGTDTYGTTAAIAAEAARRLVTAPAPPGVAAPAQAYDPAAFLDTLAPYGLAWTVEADQPA
jgi:short subunit dehydrogenase-like uncharacterized protein